MATKLKHLKLSYFRSYKGTREEVGFCVVELVVVVKKQTIRDESDSKNIIVNTPLILTYLTYANELFKFLCATEELTYLTAYQKIEKPSFNFEIFNL